jgi:hypothetical protein
MWIMCFGSWPSAVSAAKIEAAEVEFTAPKVIIPAFFKKLLLELILGELTLLCRFASGSAPPAP